MAKYAATFVKKLVDENVLDEPFIIAWYDKERRLDKESGLYDKKAEKKFRELIEDYVENWLKKEDSDSSDDSSSSGKDNGKPASSKAEENKSAPQHNQDDQEEDDDAQEAAISQPRKETAAQKNMREMIARQKKEQQEAAAKLKKELQEEEAKQVDEVPEPGNSRDARIDVNQMDNEEVDIDDLWVREVAWENL